ncbi:flagellar basal-body rod protein FlgF [Ralstonia sp. 22086]|jgi:flagellar basal-body rod protein FlgF|uniref:Flagellar basal-body rod protein FlgF n=1 Tax=Ralstonia wenshanensis TaxID=2842456 RepID=A0AAD2BC81_9RALS|nr:flagellar basal-body rod protein FlgF [Ralstonia wenshanensis]MCT7307870.1 flagellar basal-body rod protein FlgF [Ralstonia wenshanensis]MDY7509903.1 flagellar basal-body rod protein FlgF [Ralstonia wenshanensis]UGS88308.1 flagellar basal-body rod protein FlgF [Ralstonia wenshanensis]CAJ0707461.1 Flagellar basal-body rod protein FlgF [Ralstonia wenshanensis]CAJ0815528.1 Flagellar basal-body rod protein FlgF [Ralstonia wenshanensis]
MDRSIYVSMTGVKHLFDQQAASANNLANASTTGFKAQIDAFHTVGVQGDGSPTRSYVMASAIGTDLAPGPIETTGRSLDVAIDGQGFFAVQTPDGSEAYTRAGTFQLGPDGTIQTLSGQPVLGDGGPITLPPDTTVQFAKDGTVNAISADSRTPPVSLGRLKLVSIDPSNIDRGADGLFRQRDGQDADVDEKVRVTGGALEGSNVNLTDSLVNMIEISRQLEMQMKSLHTSDTNAQSANELLRHA